MKIALVPLNPVIGDICANTDKILTYIERAIAQGCDLIIFPELALMGYPPKDYLFYKTLIERQNKSIVALKRKSKKITIVVGGVSLNKSTGSPFKNEIFVFKHGQQQVYTKQLLPNYDVFDESRYFAPGTAPLIMNIGGKRFGFSICEDVWYHEKKLKSRYPANPLEKYKNSRLDFLINISASPFELDKFARRKELLIRAAQDLDCPVIHVNQFGGNDELVFDGGCLVCSPKQQTLYQSPLFVEDLFIYDIESPPQKTELPQYSRSELLEKALITGTHDYCHKTGFSQVVLGLSGGVDSALVAVIATKALGKENVLGVMLPSRFSSRGSIADAQRLAENLGIETQKIEINPIHKVHEKVLNQIFKKKINDVTAQNIQARIRANLLMAISNNTGRLLLNTSNKSEAAMGYGTLYGDMCGALAVISDLTKTQVYELCLAINRDEEIIPEEIIIKAPSAELKPDQKDSDSLPPYDKLDPIIEDFIDQFVVRHELTESTLSTKQVIQKILQNEYKRYQAPPGLKVTGKAFGTGRRIPIAARMEV